MGLSLRNQLLTIFLNILMTAHLILIIRFPQMLYIYNAVYPAQPHLYILETGFVREHNMSTYLLLLAVGFDLIYIHVVTHFILSLFIV